MTNIRKRAEFNRESDRLFRRRWGLI